MEHQEPRRTVVLGIDPGRSTGLYCVSIPKLDRALTLDELQRDARWAGNAAISLSSRQSLTMVQAWQEMHKRLADALDSARPDLIVLEHPADGMPKFSASGGFSARGTDFTMGMFFGFAALAAAQHQSTSVDGRRQIALMPVTSSKAKQRVGWMPRVTTQKGNRRVTHTQDRATTLRQCREIAHAIGENSGQQSSEDVDVLSEHELMALGVLTYYVTHRAPADWGN
jgi:hypothetical protein